MILTLSSVRGAPGVTSWALLLAAAWPQAFEVDRVVVEADVDGGVIGARYGLGVEPGTAGLVAAARRRGADGPVDLAAFARRLAGGVWVVPEPESAEQCCVVWASSATVDGIASLAAADERVWIVDAGRLRSDGIIAPLAAHAALTVVLCRDAQEDLVQVPARVASLQRVAASVGVMVVGQPPYHRDELTQFFGTRLMWQTDASPAKELLAVAGAVMTDNRRARRTLVWRAALEIAAGMAERATAPLDGSGPFESADVRAAAGDG